ncbi:monocarboxylate transporter 12-like [Tribolium madens]|uniref:monocarboxylate transporter 12-like n=1 Tax=Tribolium madens TaxID=41895 RepID=UPI001CF75AB2|nr:monocarboxylate transporter 12-like [Tribolium madens]
METTENKQKLVKIPPDGGYGWVIVFANALSNFITVPLIHCFGLIFKDTFTELGLSATQGSLIINLNGAFGMMTGLINGVLLKVYGCRKVAFLAAFLLTGGVVLTSFSKSFAHFVVSYGLITSLGIGMCQSSYGLALNMYFKEKRNVAMGFAVTITGLGPIIIPQLIGFLMTIYTPQDVTFIFGGICAHVFIAALLLQPVEWHMKTEKQTIEELLPVVTKTEETVWGRLFQNIVKTFDLDLLKDPIFVNIMMGMALAIFAELNFTVLTPFMLQEFGLDTAQTATFLSTLGITDIIFRFFAPYIGNFFTKPPRLMYAYSLILLIITRFTFLMSNDFYLLLVIALGLGIAKGIRKVYMGLVIPAHVPIEKLASANGMEMMMNGFCIIIGGLVLGLVRDVTGSYKLCVVIMNCVTFTTILMWSLEALIVKCRKKEQVLEHGISLQQVNSKT